jgi:ACR3 family arsenite efflux pump ArsB
MMNKHSLKLLRPMLIVFIFLNVFFVTGRSMLVKQGADPDVLIMGDILLFLVSFLAFQISYKALGSSNPQSFVRAMYGSFILKFFVIAIAAFIYIMIMKKKVNKPSLAGCMVLYVMYTFLEVSALMKLLKRKKNA